MLRTSGILVFLAACGLVGYEEVGGVDASFQDDPRLPALDLDLRAGPLDSRLHFIRDDAGRAVASYLDASGRVRFATPGAPRFDHDPLTGAPLGLLIEESRTNLLPNSQDYSADTGWGGGGGGITSVAGSAPDGNVAYLLEDASAVSSQQLRRWVPIPDDDKAYTLSVYVKEGSSSELTLDIYFANGGIGKDCWQHARIDSGGTGLTWLQAASSVQDKGVQVLREGWLRVWISCTNNASGNTQVRWTLNGVTDANNDGQETGTMLVWGAQLEAGQSPSSYIPTGPTAVSRAADQLEITDMTWFDSASGSFYVHGDITHALSNAAYFAQIGSGDNRHVLYADPQVGYGLENVAVTTLGAEGAMWEAGARHKFAGSYQTSSAALYWDGTQIATADNPPIPTDSSARLGGGDQPSQNALNGHISRFVYWDRPGSPADMTFMTHPFRILGITGGSDTLDDHALTDLSGVDPVLKWAAGTGQGSFEATIYEQDASTAKCGPIVDLAPDVTSHVFAGCPLLAGRTYAAEVIAHGDATHLKAVADDGWFFFTIATP